MIKKKYLFLIATVGLLVCIDQATKLWVHSQFALGEEFGLIKGLFSITYVRNYGAAFGILRDAHEGFREFFFMIIPPLALLLILALLRGIRDSDRASIFALSSVFAGALGNYIDRVRLGYVIDFLDFFIAPNHWPAFNVADMAIVCGITVLLFLEWTRKSVEKKVA